MAVMALERVPSDIRKFGGVARMSDPKLIEEIKAAVTIPVMAKCRIGHFVEAQILQRSRSTSSTSRRCSPRPTRSTTSTSTSSAVPFVCGCRDLGEALRRIGEGAAMIRTKGEAGTGNIVEAVRHMRAVRTGIAELRSMRADELFAAAKELRAPLDVVRQVARRSASCRCRTSAPVASPPPPTRPSCASSAREAVFVGSGIFKAENPERVAKAIVKATTHCDNPEILAEVSTGLGEPMHGLELAEIPDAGTAGRPRLVGGGQDRWRRPRRRPPRPPPDAGSASSRCRATCREHAARPARDRRRAGRGPTSARPGRGSTR